RSSDRRRHVALPARLRGRRALPSRAGRTYQEADGSLPGPSRAEPQGHGARALAPPHPARRLAVLGPGGRAPPPSARKAEPAAPGRRRAVAGALLPAALRTPLRSRRTSLPHGDLPRLQAPGGHGLPAAGGARGADLR